MLAFRNILYPTDFSECARQSFDYALLFARIFEAKIHALHGVALNASDPYSAAYHFPNIEEISSRLRDIASSQMAEFLSHRGQGIEIEEIQKSGSSAGQIILDYADSQDIDLIVMGTRGRGRVKRFFLGSVAAEVMRFARCPVLTSRGGTDLRTVGPAKVVLAAVDFSENSKTALSWAREIASAGGAQLHVVHVLESRHYAGFFASEGQKVMSGIERIQDMGEARLRQFAEALPGPEVQHEFHTVVGRAVIELLTLADRLEADLIVAGSQGFDPVADLVFGSTAEGLACRSACPVLTVKGSATS